MTKETRTTDRRKEGRKYLAYYTRVWNADSEEIIGNLGDLTASGAMVITNTPLTVPADYRLKVELSDDVADKAFLLFSATSAWLRPDLDPNRFNIGFAITEIDPEDLAIIKRILEEYGLRDN